MQKFCPRCKTPLKEDAVFCSECGLKTEGVASEKPPVSPDLRRTIPSVAPKPPAFRGLLILGIGVIAALILIVAILLLLLGNLSEKKENTVSEPSMTEAPYETEAPTLTPMPVPTAAPVSSETEAIISRIRELYYHTQDKMGIYIPVRDGEVTRYYSPESAYLTRLDASREGSGESYYYVNGDLYFIFAHNGEREDRLYFDDGRLIRWIVSWQEGAEEVYEGAASHSAYAQTEAAWLAKSASYKPEVTFRVRKSADDVAGQIGAYKEFENAKNRADAYKNQGYRVYTMYGEVFYDPNN